MGRYRKDFTLYPRRMKDGRRVWYYRAYDKHGRRTAGISTGQTSKTLAEKRCAELKAEGRLIPTEARVLPEVPTLRTWAETERWWQWGECRYLRGQLAGSTKGRPAVSKRYADDALRELRKWILPYHGSKRLDEITTRDCEDLRFAWEKAGLSRKSIINKANIHQIMLAEAARLKLIPENPWTRARIFQADKHPKGILTVEEARRLLNPATIEKVWKGNQVYHGASLLASVTGLRLGEVLALKRDDLFPDHVHVACAWKGTRYGLGRTKTKRIDDLPIPALVYEILTSWCTWQGFVFSFQRGAHPVSGNRTLDALYGALEQIGILKAERDRRNIRFHSWRAFANTYMRARGISDAKVRRLTRHVSEEMTERYTAFRLEDFTEVAAAQEELVAPLGKS